MNALRRAAGKLGEAIGLPVSSGLTGVDTTLENYRERLQLIVDQFAQAKATAQQFGKSVLHSAAASRLVGEEVHSLFGSQTGAGEELGLPHFLLVSQRIENHSQTVFKQKYGWELLKLFDDFTDEANSLQNKLTQAFGALESLSKAETSYNQFKSAKEKRAQKGQELTPKEELIMKGAEDQYHKYLKAYKEIRQELDDTFKLFFQRKSQVLSEIFVRFIEFQTGFLQYQLVQLKATQEKVEGYTRSHPGMGISQGNNEHEHETSHRTAGSPNGVNGSHAASGSATGSDRSYSLFRAEQERAKKEHEQQHVPKLPKMPRISPSESREESENDDESGSGSEESHSKSDSNSDLDYHEEELDLDESDHEIEQHQYKGLHEKGKSKSSKKDKEKEKVKSNVKSESSPTGAAASSSHVDFLGLGSGPAPIDHRIASAPSASQSHSHHHSNQAPHRNTASPLEDFFAAASPTAASGPSASVAKPVAKPAAKPAELDLFNFPAPAASSTPAPSKPAPAPVSSSTSFDFFDSLTAAPETRPASKSFAPSASGPSPTNSSSSAASRPRVGTTLATEAPKITMSNVAQVAQEAANEKIEFIRAQEEAAEAEQNAKRDASHALDATLNNWEMKDGQKKSIRTLLSTLHTVLWSGSGWKPCSMADLIDFNAIKKMHRKAMLIVHPDKVLDATPEQKVISERLFDALNTAFERFQSTGQ